MANELTGNRLHRVPDRWPVPLPVTGSGGHLRVNHGRPCPDLHVCGLVGEVDLGTASVLREALRSAERGHARSVIVDMSRVEFLGAIGVGILLAAARSAPRRGRLFALVVGTRPVRRVLDLTGAAAEITSYRSLPEALRAHSSLWCRAGR